MGGGLSVSRDLLASGTRQKHIAVTGDESPQDLWHHWAPLDADDLENKTHVNATREPVKHQVRRYDTVEVPGSSPVTPTTQAQRRALRGRYGEDARSRRGHVGPRAVAPMSVRFPKSPAVP